jgi:hypothetical protein
MTPLSPTGKIPSDHDRHEDRYCLLDRVHAIASCLTLGALLASPLAQVAQSIGVAADWHQFYARFGL